MNPGKARYAGAALAIVMFAAGLPAELRAQQDGLSVAIGVGGGVTTRFGPEAGVWMIAETVELGIRFAKIAVTDERGVCRARHA